eukprot:PLAT16167.2.p1 GENE.PLAT16167.2~~PLAT16167.2.p1  ORF type:complete len:189 (+),score=54.10 PLAT16167.2:49-567(+)
MDVDVISRRLERCERVQGGGSRLRKRIALVKGRADGLNSESLRAFWNRLDELGLLSVTDVRSKAPASVKRLLVLDGEESMRTVGALLQRVDQLRDSISPDYIKSLPALEDRLTGIEQQLLGAASIVQQRHARVQRLLALYSDAMDALSHRFVLADSRLSAVESRAASAAGDA